MVTVGDFLTRIRNAGFAKHEKVDIPSSNLRAGIAGVLKDCGYIRSFKVAKDGNQGFMRVYLKYNNSGVHVIKNLERFSRPGRRYYVGASKIPQIRSGYGISILSTNKGILSNEQATKENIGGEILCKVW